MSASASAPASSVFRRNGGHTIEPALRVSPQMPTPRSKLIVVILAALSATVAIAAEEHEHHAHGFAREVEDFHSVLAPLWHAQQGKERSRQVCAKAQNLELLAKAIRQGNSKPLLSSIAALRAQCQTSPGEIDAVFSRVHDAFHRLAEPGQH